MAKRSILKFLSLPGVLVRRPGIRCRFSRCCCRLIKRFNSPTKVKKADRLLLSWDIANGYYLYRHKFKFVSLTPGIKVGEQSFPASHTKHDATFR